MEDVRKHDQLDQKQLAFGMKIRKTRKNGDEECES
jgi:hypothetical protein